MPRKRGHLLSLTSPLFAQLLTGCWFNPAGNPEATDATPSTSTSSAQPTTAATTTSGGSTPVDGTTAPIDGTTAPVDGTTAPVDGTTAPVDTSASSSGSSLGTTAPPEECTEMTTMLSPVRPSVVLVVDKSGSMTSQPSGYWDHDGDDANNDMIKDNDPNNVAATPRISRWNSLHSALVEFVVDFDGTMDLGMSLFPSKQALSDYSAAACPVNLLPEVLVAPNNAQALVSTLPAANDSLKGATPTTKAVKATFAHLDSLQTEGPRHVILVTDGAANCWEEAPDNTSLFEVYDNSLEPLLATWQSAGISTFVVGIAIKNEVSSMVKDGTPDNVNPHVKLNDAAVAGGAPLEGVTKFYDAQNEPQLKAAFAHIVGRIISCEAALDQLPEHPDALKIEVDGTLYSKKLIEDCATESGWRYVDDTHTAVELCGEACTDYRKSGEIEVRYGCPD